MLLLLASVSNARKNPQNARFAGLLLLSQCRDCSCDTSYCESEKLSFKPTYHHAIHAVVTGIDRVIVTRTRHRSIVPFVRGSSSSCELVFPGYDSKRSLNFTKSTRFTHERSFNEDCILHVRIPFETYSCR